MSQDLFVKICGITSEADALLSVSLGASAVGFIFAPSPRQVSVQLAGDIAKVDDDAVRADTLGAMRSDPGVLLFRKTLELRDRTKSRNDFRQGSWRRRRNCARRTSRSSA